MSLRAWHGILRQCMVHGRKSVVPASVLSQLCRTYDESGDKSRALVALGRAGYVHKELNIRTGLSGNPWGMIEVREKLMPDYQPLITACGRTAEGVKFVMSMRQDCISAMRSPSFKDDKDNFLAVKALEKDLFAALSSWFSGGLAKLHRVRWDTSSGELLENLMNLEAVHEINTIADLKHRLYLHNRRVFAFCHPVTGENEPLVILYVALTREIADSVDHLIRDEHEPPIERPTTAIFYSISSRGNSIGLSQVDLGNHMIRNAVLYLKQDHPTITTFSTLSPMPGFATWLRQFKASDSSIDKLFDIYENGPGDDNNSLKSFIRNHDSLLRTYAARYLYQAKRRSSALDGVANFHLRNGAAIFRVNTLANTSAKGFRESFGYMVNYLYDLDQLEPNQQKYHFSHEINTLEPFKNALSPLNS